MKLNKKLVCVMLLTGAWCHGLDKLTDAEIAQVAQDYANDTTITTPTELENAMSGRVSPFSAGQVTDAWKKLKGYVSKPSGSGTGGGQKYQMQEQELTPAMAKMIQDLIQSHQSEIAADSDGTNQALKQKLDKELKEQIEINGFQAAAGKIIGDFKTKLRLARKVFQEEQLILPLAQKYQNEDISSFPLRSAFSRRISSELDRGLHEKLFDEIRRLQGNSSAVLTGMSVDAWVQQNGDAVVAALRAAGVTDANEITFDMIQQVTNNAITVVASQPAAVSTSVQEETPVLGRMAFLAELKKKRAPSSPALASQQPTQPQQQSNTTSAAAQSQFAPLTVDDAGKQQLINALKARFAGQPMPVMNQQSAPTQGYNPSTMPVNPPMLGVGGAGRPPVTLGGMGDIKKALQLAKKLVKP